MSEDLHKKTYSHRDILIRFETISESQMWSWTISKLFTEVLMDTCSMPTFGIPLLQHWWKIWKVVCSHLQCIHTYTYTYIKIKKKLFEELALLCTKKPWRVPVWCSLSRKRKSHLSKYSPCWLWSQTLLKGLYLLLDHTSSSEQAQLYQSKESLRVTAILSLSIGKAAVTAQ